MKKLFSLFVVVCVLSVFSTLYAFTVAPFPYESDIDPSEIAKWKVVKNTDIDSGTWTYMVKVTNGHRDAVLLVQLPFDRVVGYAYYQNGLRIYNVSILKCKYIEIPHKQNTVEVIEKVFGYKGM